MFCFCVFFSLDNKLFHFSQVHKRLKDCKIVFNSSHINHIFPLSIVFHHCLELLLIEFVMLFTHQMSHQKCCDNVLHSCGPVRLNDDSLYFVSSQTTSSDNPSRVRHMMPTHLIGSDLSSLLGRNELSFIDSTHLEYPSIPPTHTHFSG